MKQPLFLRACQNRPDEPRRARRPPVWMMRQAGRYLEEYRELRARHTFLELCRAPELAAEVTLQPLRRFPLDAAIIFADILLPLDALGCGLEFVKGEGPVFNHPIRAREDLRSLRRVDVGRDLGYVPAALRLVREELPPSVALLGFSGSPWTQAAYAVQGGMSKTYPRLLQWAHSDPTGLRELLDLLADLGTEYLEAQIEAGAQALQIFDTWGGLLSAEDYRQIALPSVARMVEPLRGRVPLIFFGQGNSHLLPVLGELELDVYSIDWRVPLTEARSQLGDRPALQGNLDPAILLASQATIEERCGRLRGEAARACPDGNYIANLGHGILPQTPPENAAHFIQCMQAEGL